MISVIIIILEIFKLCARVTFVNCKRISVIINICYHGIHQSLLSFRKLSFSLTMASEIMRMTIATIQRICYSYTFCHEYRLARNRFSRLLFTSEVRLCANLRVQEKSKNMKSQCQYPICARGHRSTVMTSQF